MSPQEEEFISDHNYEDAEEGESVRKRDSKKERDGKDSINMRD